MTGDSDSTQWYHRILYAAIAETRQLQRTSSDGTAADLRRLQFAVASRDRYKALEEVERRRTVQ